MNIRIKMADHPTRRGTLVALVPATEASGIDRLDPVGVVIWDDNYTFESLDLDEMIALSETDIFAEGLKS